MAVWQSVSELTDGQEVAASTFNRPLGELTSRTEYLKDLLGKLRLQDSRSVVTVDVVLVDRDTPDVGDMVCADPSSGKYMKAVASMSLYDAYTASVKAFALGMLTRKDGNGLSGTVTLYGRVQMDFSTLNLVDRGKFVTGQYYLSSTVPGKITRFPNGPRILVGFFTKVTQKNGDFQGGEAYINPQYMDIEAHAHRTYTLLARPSGVSSVVYDGVEQDMPEPVPPAPHKTGLPIIGDDLASYRIGVDEEQQLYVEDAPVDQRSIGSRDVSDFNDSAESNDSNDQLPIGRVVVNGYLPQEVANNGIGIPYLVVCGDWTVDYAENYAVTISNGVVDCDQLSSTWPVDVVWYKVGTDEHGSGQLHFFGDSVAVGKHGLRVKLQPSAGMSEATPFGVSGLTDAQRTWYVDRFSGRGWSQADADTVVDFGSGKIRFGGVSDKFMNHVVAQVPEKIYDLTESIQSIAEGETLEIDGRKYKFTTDPEPEDSNDSAEQVTYIQILDNTVRHDTFDTLAQLCDYEDGAVFYESKDDSLRQVLLGADSVLFNENPVTEAVSSTTTDMFALVSYDNGESLLDPVIVGQARTMSVIKVESWNIARLRNGFTMMVVPGDGVELGSKATADIYCVPGAKYRYNIEFDNDLKLHFPPVPARSGSLMLNGVELESYEHYGDKAVIAIGDDSIYWRDDTEGRQPWPIPAMAQTDPVDPEDEYRELFHFVSEFHSETGPVTSLHPAEGSPITIHRCGTDEDAHVGDLELDVDLTIGMSDQGSPGYKVPKSSRGGKLLLGPVVERVVAGPGISISHSAGVPDGQGIVTITADGSEYAGDFETLALENAKLESIGMFPYVRLLKWDPDSDSNIPTGFVAKFHVPATSLPGVYRVKFYATVFGETSFEGGGYQTAGVKMDYNILPDYTGNGADMLETANLKTGLIRPDESFVLNIPFGTTETNPEVSYTAYDPLLIHNDSSLEDLYGRSVQVIDHAFPTEDECQDYIRNNLNKVSGVFGVRPGYTVAVRFSRTAPTDGTPYTGAIGFLNLRWAIEEVATVSVTEPDKVDDIVAQTVRALRRAAVNSGPLQSGYSVATVLQKIVNALK